MIKAYFKYRNERVNAHGIHSPFVFEFYNEVLRKTSEIDDSDITRLRRRLYSDATAIEITDLGEGSKKSNSNSRRIKEIAKVSGISKKYGRLLSKIVSYYNLQSGIELGTSLGLGTAYLSLPNSMERLLTIEGCPNVLGVAKKNLKELERSNVIFENGNFDDVLIDCIDKLEKVDIAFIDGNHGYESTMKYFQVISEKAHNDTFIIFDDINWSTGMRRAWDEIVRSDKMNVSIELFRMGIVVKREEQAKQHFVLKF